MRDVFSSYHPLVIFFWFITVMTGGMTLMHPLCLFVSLCASFAYSVYLKGWRALRFNLIMLPIALLAALINPLFNRRGMTILAYLPNGAPLTLESLCYGLAAATMIITVIFWFSCYNHVMTSDKTVWLFGRILPAVSLIIVMSVRLFPRFNEQYHEVAAAQYSLGYDTGSGTVRQRVKSASVIFSSTFDWILEGTAAAADSMKSRGYGLSNRTSFTLFRFEKRDLRLLVVMLIMAAVFITALATGIISWRYFPLMQGAEANSGFWLTALLYLLFCTLPLLLGIWDEYKWRSHKWKKQL